MASSDQNHVEACLAEGLEVATGVCQEVDGTIPCSYACSLDARGVVGAVAVSGFGRIDLVRPDDVGVAVPGGAEGVDEGEVSPSTLYQHHVPERASVMQDRSVPFRVPGHGLDRPSSPEIPATVVGSVGLTHTDKGYGEHHYRQRDQKNPVGGEADRQVFRPSQDGPHSRRDSQCESQESGDEEHVEVLDTELEIHDGLAETTEEEHAEEEHRRAVPKQQVDGGEHPDQHQDDGELPEEMTPE